MSWVISAVIVIALIAFLEYKGVPVHEIFTNVDSDDWDFE
jgi:hypothetical protein